MNCELRIKEVLEGGYSPEKKAKIICSFMTWNMKELIECIKNIGTDTDTERGEIIDHFWKKYGKKS